MFHRLLATRPTSLPLVLRVAAGTLFVLFSFGKFVRRDAEVRTFESRERRGRLVILRSRAPPV